MRYSDEQLAGMLADLESELVERKETFRGDAPVSVREAVAAYANDLPGHQRPGVVFIGSRDDGSRSGLVITDELLLQLADIKSDGNIVPPPSLSVEKRTLGGAEFAVVTVEPSDSPPVRYRGRIPVRIGPRREFATAQDERVLNERRRFRDHPFDMQRVAGATIADLDLRYFEERYLPAAFAPDVIEANDRTVEQRLLATKMLAPTEPPTPTVVGVLTLGRAPRNFLPGAYIQFLRIQGETIDSPITDELVIDGAVEDLVRRAEEKLVAHNRIAVNFTSEPLEARRPLYPLVALQQFVRNAVLHRAYDATNAPIRVYWYDDRIEFLNVGGLYGAVTLANLGESGVTDYRNPNLAEAMRVLGLVQRFGAGIATARRALAANGNPAPEFANGANHFRVTVRPIAVTAQG